MPTYIVPGPDGKEYDVDAADPGEAGKKLHMHLQGEANTRAQSEFSDAPVWAKPFMAADDLARTTADTLSFGLLDKMLGPQAQMETAARRSRMGGADVAGDIAAGMAIPTGAPAAIARVGGGPIVRGVTGLLTGGASGAAQGGLAAAGHDQPVGPGMIQGALAGTGGQAIGQAVGGVVNPAAKLIKGVDDSLPAASTKNVPGKAPNPARRVEARAAEAEKQGGTARDYKESFKEMNTGKLPQSVLDARQNIVFGDTGTKAANLVSSLATKAAAGALPMGLHSVPAGIGMAVGLPALGAAAKFAANQGTKESVDALRRQLLSIPKFQGPLSKQMVDRISRMSRAELLSAMSED